MSEVLAAHPDAERILVDIPIGLPSKQCPVRPCDLLARKLLGAPSASSVFPPPSRAACRAASVAEARRINLSEVERSLSEQAWGICRKVAEVGALLLAQSAARKVVREMHPEVCFYAPQLRILEEDILPRFAAREIASAESLLPQLPPLPELR